MLIYPLHLKVPARLLSPVLELLEGEGIQVSIGSPEDERRKTLGHRSRSTPGGLGRQIVLETANRNGTRDEVKRLFEVAGFKGSSSSSAMSKAKSDGLVIYQPRGKLSITPAGTEMLEYIAAKGH